MTQYAEGARMQISADFLSENKEDGGAPCLVLK
jgi:hypothetical protein